MLIHFLYINIIIILNKKNKKNGFIPLINSLIKVPDNISFILYESSLKKRRVGLVANVFCIDLYLSNKVSSSK